MKLKSLLLVAAIALLPDANAQTTTQIGFGNATGSGPFNGTVYPLQKTERIIHYTQSEMVNAGMAPGAHITSVKWFKSNVAQYTIPNAARAILYMRNLVPGLANGYSVQTFDHDSLLAAINYQPVDTVYYDNDQNAIDNNNWTGFSGFDFEFTGEDLEIYVKYEVIGSVSGLNDGIEWKMFTADANVRHLMSSVTNNNFSTGAARPNTQFVYTASSTPVCPQIVEAGQATDDINGTVQPGTLVTFDLTGVYTNVQGLTTYKWQSAPNIAGPWTDISGVLSAPTFQYTVPLVTQVYRAIVTCGSGIDSTNNISVPVDGSECQGLIAGTAFSNTTGPMCPGTNFELDVLNNTGMPGTATFTWELAPTQNGPWSVYSVTLPYAIIGLGAPNSTTWYRAKVECGNVVDYTNAVEVEITPGPSGNYTINSAVPTGGTNFQSFADAIASLGCGISGDVIFDVVAGSGPYNEQVLLGDNIPTTSSATITFNGNGNTLSHISNNENQMAVVTLNGIDYVTFKNFKIEVTGTDPAGFGIGVQMLNDADHNTIDSCEIIVNEAVSSAGNASYAGIVVNGGVIAIEDGTTAYCDNNQLLNNTVKNGYYGIVFRGPYNGDMMYGNVVKRNIVQDFYSKGIMLLNNADGLVEGNNISRPARTLSGAFFGIDIAGCASTIVNGNRIHDPAAAQPDHEFNAAAINIINSNPANTNKNTVSNNLIYNFVSNGGSMGVQLENSKNLNIYHNTISLEYQNTSCIGCLGVYGIYQQNVQATRLDIKNNIITMNGTGGGQKHMLHFEHLPMNTELDNNNYYFADGVMNTAIGHMDGDNYETMQNWQQASFGEQNSLMLNPMYEDVNNGNFKPTKDSLDNKGTYVNVDNDITGAVRNNATPDMGAYEFEVVVTSVKNNRIAAEVSIYPNPVTDLINIISPEKVDVQIMSIDGRIVTEHSNATKVDVRELSDGSYILKVLNKEGAVIKAEKLLKVSK